VSPRPRKASDDDVFAAAYRVMQRVGPDEFTLAAIADEAGLTAGALVQRFGSRRELLAKLAAASAASAPDLGAHFRAKHKHAVTALAEYVLCFAAMATTPDAMARSLAYLHNDLTDPVLRKHLVAQARGGRASLVALATEAKRDGDIVAGTDTEALAHLLEAIMSGSLMTWAIHREGTARAALRADLDTALVPYLSAQGRRRLRTLK
jgi:AcrR family transcriptional regulator